MGHESQGEQFTESGPSKRLAYLRVKQHIFDSVKASLKRLQLDYIDVLQSASRLVLWLPVHQLISGNCSKCTDSQAAPPSKKLCAFQCTSIRYNRTHAADVDDCPARPSQAGTCPVHRNEFLLRLVVYVLYDFVGSV